MPRARAVKRTASNASGSGPSKIKKKTSLLPIPTRKRVKCRLLACGCGDVGQLGLGEDVMECSRFKHVAALGDRVVDACAGGMHSVALDADGKVWTFGCNDEGALGRAAAEGGEFVPGAVTLPGRAVAISAGDSHSAALLENGDVYIWGSFRDSHGSMGLQVAGKEGRGCREPVPLPLPAPAAAIASGGDHVAALTTAGALLTAGCGEQGQLGRLSERSASRHSRQGLGPLLTPSVVTMKGQVRRVWAGSHATVALAQHARLDREAVYVTGLNNYRQLGVVGARNKPIQAIYAPTESAAFSAATPADVAGEGGAWAQVACGAHHTLAVDAAGKCYALGRHDYGRLGLGAECGDAEALTAVPRLADKRCVSVAATTCSSFAVTHTGEAYAWGMGSEGQLGTGGEDDEPEPRLLAGAALAARKATLVSAGGQHTLLLVADINAKPSPEREEPEGQEEPQKVEAVKDKKEKETEKKKSPEIKKSAEKREAAEVSSTTSAEPMEVDSSRLAKEVSGVAAAAAAAAAADTPMDTDQTDAAGVEAVEAVEAPTDQIQEVTKAATEPCNATSGADVKQRDLTDVTKDDKISVENDKKDTSDVKNVTIEQSSDKEMDSIEEAASEAVESEVEAKTEAVKDAIKDNDVEMAPAVVPAVAPAVVPAVVPAVAPSDKPALNGNGELNKEKTEFISDKLKSTDNTDAVVDEVSSA